MSLVSLSSFSKIILYNSRLCNGKKKIFNCTVKGDKVKVDLL